MGTSQSHNLKTTPQWSNAKRAMTGIIKTSNGFSSFMGAFLTALGDDGLYRGGHVGEHHDNKHAFGTAGSKTAIYLLDFISGVKENGLQEAVNFISQDSGETPTNPRELINFLCAFSSNETDADIDADAASVAQRKVLSKIFKDCGVLEDVETIIQNADEDTVDAWIIDFEVEYIIEYQGTLFQSHIFDKAAEPDMVLGQIRRWLHSQLDDLLSEEMHHIGIFSEEGKQFIDRLTARILDIWKQQ